jgi:hypothetical protein
LGGWGEWVNGGAWLTIDGQRLDFLYRAFDKIEHTLAEAHAGRYTIDYDQQPPFGFFGPTLLGETAIARPLWDPFGEVAALKTRVLPMPTALIGAVVQSQLWAVQFGLTAFAPKYAAAANVYAFAGCLTRFAHGLVLSLFALNGVYLLNEKTALAEIDGFAVAPPKFSSHLATILGHIGDHPSDLEAAKDALASLFNAVKDLAGPLYRQPWAI